MLILKILLGVGALLLGIWLGLPGRYEQSQEDIDRALKQGGAKRNQARRHFTPIDWFRKDRRGSEKRRGRRHFRTAVAERREEDVQQEVAGSQGDAGPEDGDDAPAASPEDR